MVSAQCFQKTLGRCTKTPGVLELKDRKGVVFPVRNNCSCCQNTIYNSTPLVLLDLVPAIEQIAPKSIRLAFSQENAKETIRVLQACTDAFLKGKTVDPGMLCREYTRGHFRRGVD